MRGKTIGDSNSGLIVFGVLAVIVAIPALWLVLKWYGAWLRSDRGRNSRTYVGYDFTNKKPFVGFVQQAGGSTHPYRRPPVPTDPTGRYEEYDPSHLYSHPGDWDYPVQPPTPPPSSPPPSQPPPNQPPQSIPGRYYRYHQQSGTDERYVDLSDFEEREG